MNEAERKKRMKLVDKKTAKHRQQTSIPQVSRVDKKTTATICPCPQETTSNITEKQETSQRNSNPERADMSAVTAGTTAGSNHLCVRSQRGQQAVRVFLVPGEVFFFVCLFNIKSYLSPTY